MSALIRPSPHALDTHDVDAYGKRIYRCRHCASRVGDDQPAHLVFRRNGGEMYCVTLTGAEEAIDELVDGLRAASRRFAGLELVEDM